VTDECRTVHSGTVTVNYSRRTGRRRRPARPVNVGRRESRDAMGVRYTAAAAAAVTCSTTVAVLGIRLRPQVSNDRQN